MKTDSEQGCSLDELSRLNYLKAMGIQPWFSKFVTLQAIAETPQSIESIAKISEGLVEPENTNSNKLPVAELPLSDESSMNWQQLQQAVSQCQLCELHTSRTQTVFGMGDPHADLLIITEAPGADEDTAGEPFVGQTGQLLDAMLKAIDLSRDKVFITNVLKCCPPGERSPHVSEIVCCDTYLQRQIELIQPKIILVLGRIAAHHLLVTKDALGALRNKFHSYNGIPLLVSYHPDYLIRKPTEKRKSWQDLLLLKHRLNSF